MFSENELAELLTVARCNNQKYQITGLLLYKAPLFMQLLEGPKETVEQLFDTIKQDPRHSDVSGLIKGDIQRRTFPDWQMGFATPTLPEIREIKGFSNFLDASWCWGHLNENPKLSHRLLLSFRQQKL